MADIYGQIFCTIAALDSKDSTESCQPIPEIQRIGMSPEFDYVHSQSEWDVCSRLLSVSSSSKTPFSSSSSSLLLWYIRDSIRSGGVGGQASMAVNKISSHADGILMT